MKKLTKGQRKALAREARRLAMECVEEAAPFIGRWSGFSFEGNPICALGHVYARAFHDKAELLYAASEYPGYEKLVVFASDEFPATTRQAALVFPLLAMADELEASAANASKTPPDLTAEVP